MLAWLLVASRTARMYPLQLQQALRNRALQGGQRVNLDATGLAILQASLAEPEPGPVIYALDTWQQLQPDQLPAHFPALLEHPSPVVQLEVLQRIERLAVRAALPAVHQLANQTRDPALRGAAWRVLIAVGGPPETLEELNGLLNAPEPDVQQGVMIGLLVLLKQFYQQSWWKTILKTIVAQLLYFRHCRFLVDGCRYRSGVIAVTLVFVYVHLVQKAMCNRRKKNSNSA